MKKNKEQTKVNTTETEEPILAEGEVVEDGQEQEAPIVEVKPSLKDKVRTGMASLKTTAKKVAPKLGMVAGVAAAFIGGMVLGGALNSADAPEDAGLIPIEGPDPTDDNLNDVEDEVKDEEAETEVI